MLQTNNNLSILPFYTSLEKQNHRKDYAFGEVYPLVTPDKRLLPFQILRETSASATWNASLKNLYGVTVADIKDTLLATGFILTRFESEGYDVIQYPGNLPLTVDTPEGQYYVQLSDGSRTWYSEVFTVVRHVGDFLKIEFWDEESLDLGANKGRVNYTENFRYRVYLKTQLGRPAYPIEEQVEKRDGHTFVEKQVSEKTFKFTFLAPEFLLDAMRLIRLSDHVEVTSKGDTYEPETFLITPTWKDGGFIASVSAEFQTDTVIKKTGRGQALAEGVVFNDDFNNDFPL